MKGLLLTIAILAILMYAFTNVSLDVVATIGHVVAMLATK